MAWRRGRALGQDLRDRVLADAGRPARAVAARFGVSASDVVKARQRRRDADEAAPRPQRNHLAPRLAGHEAALRAELARRPSATCSALRDWAAERGVTVSRTAIWRTLARLGLTLKESRSGRPSRRARTSPRPGGPGPTRGPRSTPRASCSLMRPGRRRPWRAATAGDHAASACWTACPPGTGRPRPLSAPCARTGSRHRACWMARSTAARSWPTCASASRAPVPRVRQCLAPALHPGDVLVMDHLSSHKVAGLREAVEAAGATLLYLPPYSPELNPIAMGFSKLKALLRTEAARTVKHLWTAIGHSLAHCGYIQAG